MDAPTIGRPMGARCATYTLHRVSAQHLLSYRHPESRVYSVRARENPFTQPSPSFRSVTPTDVWVTRAHVCVRIRRTCACVRAFLRSLARSFVQKRRATAMCARTSTLGTFVLFANPLLRSCGRALRLRLAPAVCPSSSLFFFFFFKRERRRVREDNSNVPSARQGSSSPSRLNPSLLPIHTRRGTHLGRSHTSLRLSRRIAKKREGEPNEHAPVTVHYRFCIPRVTPFSLRSFSVYARMHVEEPLARSAELISRLDPHTSPSSSSNS